MGRYPNRRRLVLPLPGCRRLWPTGTSATHEWVNDWPVIGIDKDGDGCGEPVMTYKKPNVGKTYPICTPQESDEFDGYTLSPQWQWHANINEKWAYYAGDQSIVRLYSYP